MIRIGIPARGLTRQSAGPQEFLQGLIWGLLNHTTFKVFVFYDAKEGRGLFPRAHEIVLPKSSRIIWDHVIFPRALARYEVDWVIYPKNTISLVVPRSIRTSVIVTDLGYYYPKLRAYRLLDTLYMRWAMRYAIQRAWSVFAISEFTRKDILQWFSVPSEKVVTIYAAPHQRFQRSTDPALLNDIRKKYHLHEPFVFYPTSLSPRKNIERVLKAFTFLLDRIPHHLYFTGGLAWNVDRSLISLLESLQERVHLLGKVPPEDMPALYSLADVCIYPSLFEGFGLPIVEAFRCEVPVLTSNVTSMPEVAGDAALLVDPYNVSSIQEGIFRLVTDHELRERLIKAGKTRAALFSWERTVGILKQWVDTHW